MTLEVRLATLADRPVLDPLYDRYRHELHRYDDEVNLVDPLQEDWFTRPELLHPYLAWRDGAPIGLAFVLGRAYSEAVGHDADWYLYELYVTPEHRRAGLALRLMERVWANHPGLWVLSVLHTNHTARAFWERALSRFDPESSEDRKQRTYRMRVGESPGT